MENKKHTTRVYKYGAVPLGPFPEEGVDALCKANRLWNNLVEIHRNHQALYDRRRREADGEYARLAKQLDDLEEKIKKAFDNKRTARMKAQTRSPGDPLIQAANARINALKQERKRLWDAIKPARKRADGLIDKKPLNDAFNEAVKNAQRVDSTGGLDGPTANEVARNFKEARNKVFKDPKSRLRMHLFDGAGYRFYRFRDSKIKTTKDGVLFSYFTPDSENDRRPFLLTLAGKARKGRKAREGWRRYRLRIKVAGGAREDSKVYADFDLIMHRPIPDGAQINNAKLMRNRVGDKFKYTVNFSVRVPEAPLGPKKPADAVGVDIGFRRLLGGVIRAATIAGTAKDARFQTIDLPKDYLDRVKHIETLQSELDDAAAALGKVIKPLLKAGAVLPEDHPRYPFIKRIAAAPKNVTMSFEQAYKLGKWLKNQPGALPQKVEEEAVKWWETNSRSYREMHHLRKKTLARRKEEYRIIAADLVSRGLPIGIEEIDLDDFAEVRDRDNELSDKARRQRFMVSNSELIGAIENAARREGVDVIPVPARNTSKRCSACNKINKNLKSELKWSCPACGAAHDRDENAALNIARAALKK